MNPISLTPVSPLFSPLSWALQLFILKKYSSQTTPHTHTVKKADQQTRPVTLKFFNRGLGQHPSNVEYQAGWG